MGGRDHMVECELCGTYYGGFNGPDECPCKYLPDEPPNDDDVERAKTIAREKGWLVGDEWQWDKMEAA